jgi:hypothetical protein
VGDYTAKPDHRYTYRVVALTGSPGQLTPVEEVSVAVRTERHRLGAHTIVFNRGRHALPQRPSHHGT